MEKDIGLLSQPEQNAPTGNFLKQLGHRTAEQKTNGLIVGLSSIFIAATLLFAFPKGANSESKSANNPPETNPYSLILTPKEIQKPISSTTVETTTATILPPPRPENTFTAEWESNHTPAGETPPLIFPTSAITTYMPIPQGVEYLVQPKIFNMKHGTPTEVSWSDKGIIWKQIPNPYNLEGFSFAYLGVKTGTVPITRFHTDQVVTSPFTTTLAACESYGGDGPAWICLRTNSGFCFETLWYRIHGPGNVCIVATYDVAPSDTTQLGTALLVSGSSGPNYDLTNMDHIIGEVAWPGYPPFYENPINVPKGEELILGIDAGSTQVFTPTTDWGKLVITPSQSLDLNQLFIEAEAGQWYPESRRYYGPVPGTPMTATVTDGTVISQNVRYPGGTWPSPWVEKFPIQLKPGWNELTATIQTELPFPVERTLPLRVYNGHTFLPIILK